VRSGDAKATVNMRLASPRLSACRKVSAGARSAGVANRVDRGLTAVDAGRRMSFGCAGLADLNVSETGG